MNSPLLRICFFLLTFAPSLLLAQAGELDTPFGTDGFVQTPINNGYDEATVVLQQSDGKLIVGGNSMVSGNQVFVLCRHHPDGSFDNTFGGNGIVTSVTGHINPHLEAITQQEDGKIVVAGRTDESEIAVARYLPNGDLDPSFGEGGMAFTAFFNSIQCKALTIQKDGKILVGGASVKLNSPNNFPHSTLLRYEANGQLDTSFADNGISVVDFGLLLGDNPKVSVIWKVEVLEDGKILAASAYSGNFALERYLPNGELDPDFGNRGIANTTASNLALNLRDMVIQEDGKILLMGNASNRYVAVARYEMDGRLDLDFGQSGSLLFTYISSNDPLDNQAHSMTLQADGKIVLVGQALIDNQFSFALARIDSNGQLDANFGADGIVLTSLNDMKEGFFNDLVIQTDGKIVAVGSIQRASNEKNNFVLARYLHSEILGFKNPPLALGMVKLSPNPVSSTSDFEYTLTQADRLSLQLYDSQGRLRQSFFHQRLQNAGKHREALLIHPDLSPGIYLLILQNQEGQRQITRLMLDH